MSNEDYFRRLQRAESPTGQDNLAGSGAFGRFQFMPNTAQGLATRAGWGVGMTPDQVKATVLADPGKERQLADMYTGDSDKALTGAGLPISDTSRYALHVFGPAGGVSLLQADPSMRVGDWAKSVNWGQGVSPDAVIQQNGLDRFVSVGDMRDRFLTGRIAGGGSPAPAPTMPAITITGPQREPEAAPQAPPQDPNLPFHTAAKAAIATNILGNLAAQYAQPDPQAARNAEARRTKQRLFG